jgi:hypothetical protein
MATSTRDIFAGLATTIAGAGIGVYRSDGSAYLDGETAIVFAESPPSPDRVVMMQVVPMTDETVLPSGVWMVQFYFRGLPGNRLDVHDLGDSVFDLLQGKTGFVLGSVTVDQCYRQGSVPNGMDDKLRGTRIDRYMLELNTTPTVNRPAGGWD